MNKKSFWDVLLKVLVAAITAAATALTTTSCMYGAWTVLGAYNLTPALSQGEGASPPTPSKKRGLFDATGTNIKKHLTPVKGRYFSDNKETARSLHRLRAAH